MDFNPEYDPSYTGAPPVCPICELVPPRREGPGPLLARCCPACFGHWHDGETDAGRIRALRLVQDAPRLEAGAFI